MSTCRNAPCGQPALLGPAARSRTAAQTAVWTTKRSIAESVAQQCELTAPPNHGSDARRLCRLAGFARLRFASAAKFTHAKLDHRTSYQLPVRGATVLCTVQVPVCTNPLQPLQPVGQRRVAKVCGCQAGWTTEAKSSPTPHLLPPATPTPHTHGKHRGRGLRRVMRSRTLGERPRAWDSVLITPA